MAIPDPVGYLFGALQLARPLVWLDLESTQPHELAAPNPDQDRIIDVSVLKMLPGGEVRTFHSRVNPLIPITASSTEHHGIVDADVAEAPTWRDVGPKVYAGLAGCDLAGYNVKRYDAKLLQAEAKRYKLRGADDLHRRFFIDSYVLWSKLEPRDLKAAVRRWAGEEHTDGHQSGPDVAAAMVAFAGQLMFMLQSEDGGPTTPEGLHELCFPTDPTWLDQDGKIQWRDGVPVITFGPDAGTALQDLDDGMLRWILRKDFSDEVKQIAQDALRRVYPTQKLV
jgi:DNA polymerase III subunit epsilon